MKGDRKSTGTGKRLFESPKQESIAKQRKKKDSDAHSDDGKLTDMETTHVQESQDGGAHVAAACFDNTAAPAWFTQFEERFNRIMTTTRHEIGHEIQDLKQALEFHTSQCDDKFQEMEKKLESAYDKIDDLENRSRRNNLVFFNIPEGREQNQFDCSDFMTDFLAEFVGVDDVIIERAHRTPSGPPRANQGKPRPIHVCFLNWRSKELVRRSAIKVFKSKKYENQSQKLFVSEDFSKRITQQRKELLPAMKKLRDEGKKAFFKYPAVLKFVDGDGNLKEYKPTGR